MNKIILFLMILVCINILSAQESRVMVLGGTAVILPDDNSNIDLFPQKINSFKLCRFEGLQTSSPDYLLVVGERSNKWAFYGGNEYKNDFFNVIKNLTPNSAIKIGFRLGTLNEEKDEKSEKSTSSPSEVKSSNKYTNYGFDIVYGKDSGKNEYAIGAGISSGPGYINSLQNTDWGMGPHGDFQYKSLQDSTIIDQQAGSASLLNFSIGGHIRRPQNVFIFNNLFARAYFYKSSKLNNFTSNKTSIEDERVDFSNFGTNILLFNNKKLPNNFLLVYGLGFGLNYSSEKLENEISDQKIEENHLIIGGPRLRIGLELKINFLQLRFGFIRSIDFYSSGSTFQEIATDDEIEIKSSGIGQHGTYSFLSGLGIEYKNFNINLLINNKFWITGPQMLFNDNAGDFALASDIVYNF